MDDLSPLSPTPAPKLFEIRPGVYSPQDSGYSIQMPGTPMSLSRKIKGTAGEGIFNTISSKGTDIEYNVGYIDYPPAFNDPYIAYEGYKQGHITRTGASLKSEKEIPLKDIVGREFVFKYEDVTQTSRLYFVDNRMYIVSVDVPNKHEKSKEMNQFFSSFQLIPK
jgi:hypothetical protein